MAVGTFNVYIIQPEWLERIGLIPPKTEIEIESDLHRPGFRFAVSDHSWVVFPGRLSIESKKIGTDCGAPLAQVLDNLRWTPVFGLGNNVLFSAKRDEVQVFPALEQLMARGASPQEEARAFGTTIRTSERVFNIGVTVKKDSIDLLGNAHFEFQPDGATTDRAASAAKSFLADIEALCALFSDVFGVRSDDISNK